MESRCSCRQNLNRKTLNDDVLSFSYRAMFAQKCDLGFERDDSSIRVGGGKEDEDVQVERRDRLRVEEGSHRSPDGIAVQKASGDPPIMVRTPYHATVTGYRAICSSPLTRTRFSI